MAVRPLFAGATTASVGDMNQHSLSPFIAQYLRQRHDRGEITHHTMRARRYELMSFAATFGRRPLEQLKPKAIDRWLASVRDLSPSTRRSYLTSVRGFCRWMVAEGHITSDPTIGVKPIPQPRSVPVTLGRAEIAALLAAAPDARMRAVVWLMVECGCRCVEVARLRVEDYDHRERTILLIGKGGHERRIPVPADTAYALDTYLDEVGRVSGPLIRSRRDPWSGVQADTISHWVSRLMTSAGVKARQRDGRSAHGLRRTAGSDVMDGCEDIRKVQAMLGHANIETTARYYLRPVGTAKLREAMEGRRYAA